MKSGAARLELLVARTEGIFSSLLCYDKQREGVDTSAKKCDSESSAARMCTISSIATRRLNLRPQQLCDRAPPTMEQWHVSQVSQMHSKLNQPQDCQKMMLQSCATAFC